MTTRRGGRLRRTSGRPALTGIVGVALVGALVFAVVRLQQDTDTSSSGSSEPSTTAPEPPIAVKVAGNQLVDRDGNPTRLLGVNRSGSEYACVRGYGVFEGPTDDASIAAMVSWKVNAVRLPLNEHCWLGIGGLDPQVSGEAYQGAIGDYVTRLLRRKIFVVLDLHWNAPGSGPADKTTAMADADHAARFWASVASYFRDDPGVVFDLFNEPHDISWECWRDGCTTDAGAAVVGMQSLVDAVRGTGATQPVIVGGVSFANDLSRWLEFRPNDPIGQTVAGFHLYNHNRCNTTACWDAEVAPVAASVPVVTGEFGENDCGHGFVDGFMNWADARGVSYLGWTWNEWSCEGHGLITGSDGEPTPYGVGLRDHLALVATPS
jgi:endoglucanase